MPLLWLRVAVGCYGFGLLYALLLLTRRNEKLGSLAVRVVGLGVVFQFVSLVEAALVEHQLTLASIHHSESLLAFVIPD